MVPAHQTPPSDAGHGDVRSRIAFCYAILDDLRFLSHHDEMRMVIRALTRAAWPLRYSEGFNPKPRLSIPLPRPVGLAADAQWAVIELCENRPEAELARRLREALPACCRLRAVVALRAPGKPHPVAVAYEARLHGTAAARLAPRLRRVLALETLPVNRQSGQAKPSRTVDIRPYIETLELKDGILRMGLRIRQQQTARPAELLTELGLEPEDFEQPLRRAGVEWDMDFFEPGQSPAAPEESNVGKTDEKQNEEERNDP